MPWKTMGVQDQRVRFVVAASQGEKPFSQLCTATPASRSFTARSRRSFNTASGNPRESIFFMLI